MYIEGNSKIDDYHTGGKMKDCIITLEALCNTSCLLYTAALKVLALNKPTAQHHWCHGVMTVLRRVNKPKYVLTQIHYVVLTLKLIR